MSESGKSKFVEGTNERLNKMAEAARKLKVVTKAAVFKPPLLDKNGELKK